MYSITAWIVLLVIFVLVVAVFFKLVKALARAVVYAIIFFAIVGIIFLIIVHWGFTNFVSELDNPNLYLYQENDQILFGYVDNPIRALSSSDVEKLNNNLKNFVLIKKNPDIFFKANNIFIYNRKA